MRHDHVRNAFAELFRKAGCVDVKIEQKLQPVDDELADAKRSVIRGDDARMDVTALGLWGAYERAFCDVRVVNPLAPSHVAKSLARLMKENETAKKTAYGARIREVEKGCFTPLVFTVAGGCGAEANIVIKMLASRIAESTSNRYASIMGWIRTKLSFSLLHSALVCLRGTRYRRTRSEMPSADDFETARASTALFS